MGWIISTSWPMSARSSTRFERQALRSSSLSRPTRAVNDESTCTIQILGFRGRITGPRAIVSELAGLWPRMPAWATRPETDGDADFWVEATHSRQDEFLITRAGTVDGRAQWV